MALDTAWSAHAPELRAWFCRHTGNSALADDLLQDLFLKALRQGERFAGVTHPRAWLFEVARHLLADHWRVARHLVELPEDLAAPLDAPDTVDALTACLPRVLLELSAPDREIIDLCDLQGMGQAEFAQRKGLKLSAAKSRLQRARQRLRHHMSQVCQVQLDSLGQVADFVPRATPGPSDSY